MCSILGQQIGHRFIGFPISIFNPRATEQHRLHCRYHIRRRKAHWPPSSPGASVLASQIPNERSVEKDDAAGSRQLIARCSTVARRYPETAIDASDERTGGEYDAIERRHEIERRWIAPHEQLTRIERLAKEPATQFGAIGDHDGTPVP